MSVSDWLVVVAVLIVVLPLLLSDRWGHFIGTHNWRVSRRMDRRRG